MNCDYRKCLSYGCLDRLLLSILYELINTIKQQKN